MSNRLSLIALLGTLTLATLGVVPSPLIQTDQEERIAALETTVAGHGREIERLEDRVATLAAGNGEDEDGPGSVETEDSAPEPEEGDSSEPSETDASALESEVGTYENPAPVGTTLNVEGQDITVFNPFFTHEYGYATPKGGYIFLVLEVRIENVDAAKKEHGYGEERFSATDFDTDAEFDNTFTLSDVPLGSGELSLGEFVHGIVALEVQETAHRLRVKYDANFLGKSEVYWLVERPV